MPRTAIGDVIDARLAEQASGERVTDLRVDLMDEASGAVLFTAGGRWDRRLRAFVGEAGRSKILRAHPGQIAAARYLASWLEAHLRGERILTHGRPVYGALLVGGRRGGKTDLAVKLAIVYAVARPRAIVWIVVESFPALPEIERVLEDLLPRGWYRARGEPFYRWTLINGAEIYIKSARDPSDLKRGRADVVVMNEAQEFAAGADVYAIVRPAVADKGGLVLVVANPPSRPSGRWIEDLVEKVATRTAGLVLLTIDPRLNPHVDRAALEALRDEIDERSYLREVRGEFLPPTEIVFYAFSPTHSVRPVPVTGDVTSEFVASKFGGPADAVVGLDFQRTPHMAGVVLRFFRDPEDPSTPLVWVVGEVVVEQGLEDDLVDALEAKGLRPESTVAIGDASGEFQDAERTKGKASFDVFRRRGWRRLFLPDANSRRNPPIDERIAVGNTLLRSAAGGRMLFIDPACTKLVRALGRWEMNARGLGGPSRASVYAHLGDALTYPLFRLFPRRAPRESHGITLIPRPKRTTDWL